MIDGEPGYGEENGKTWPKYWYGVKGFFRWLEKNTYKMHVRVFLSRYRSYNPCPDCGGARLQPEALCWKWEGLTLPGALRGCPWTASAGSWATSRPPGGRPAGGARVRLDPHAAAVPSGGGPRLPDARPALPNPLRAARSSA